jgi:hypothetical protein
MIWEGGEWAHGQYPDVKTKYTIPDKKNPVVAYELITKLGWRK